MPDNAVLIPSTEPPLYAHKTESNAALMRRFCSLGGNCEFGLAQRYAGAEPLDLIRFTNTYIRTLVHMLGNRFEGIGRQDLMTVKLNGKEWVTHNALYNNHWHTFTRENQMTADEVFKREVRRMPRLAEKLIEELTDGERIFVRIPLHDNKPPEKIHELVEAMRAYGPSTLFFVTLADEEHPPFTVAWEGDHLLRGWIDRFAVQGDLPATIPVESWLRLCALAANAVDERPNDRSS